MCFANRSPLAFLQAANKTRYAIEHDGIAILVETSNFDASSDGLHRDPLAIPGGAQGS
jgi:hypothetical protein